MVAFSFDLLQFDLCPQGGVVCLLGGEVAFEVVLGCVGLQLADFVGDDLVCCLGEGELFLEFEDEVG